ncbi:Guanine nucleotide-binding protein alpha-2 subunit [Ascosphaera pollenicola]|nr:Guanine nucleotide-binding protein alpha-2 subunit [Ascosphaera pollenicola]
MPSAPAIPEDKKKRDQDKDSSFSARETTQRPTSAPPDLDTELSPKLHTFFPEPINTPALFSHIQIVFRDAQDHVVEHFPKQNQEFDCRLQLPEDQFILREVITPAPVAAAHEAEGKPAVMGLDDESGTLCTSFPFTPREIVLRSLFTFDDGSLYIVFYVTPDFTIKPLQKQNGFFSSMRLRSYLKDTLLAEKRPYDTMHVLIPRQIINIKWTPVVILKIFRKIRISEYHELRQMYYQYSREWNWTGQKEGGTVERPPAGSLVDIKFDYLTRVRAVLQRFSKGGLKESWKSEVLQSRKSDQERDEEADMQTGVEPIAEIEAAMLQVELSI